MTTEHDIQPYPLPIAVEPAERVAVGERVSDLMEHPGWADLRRVIRAYQEEKSTELMMLTPSQDGAIYADLIGSMKGVAMVEPIAAGLIHDGVDAAEEQRLKED